MRLTREKLSYILLALVTCVGFYVFSNLETAALYHPDITSYPDPWQAARYVKGAAVREVFFKTKDGVQINAWYAAPKPNQHTMVFAHGNGGNIGDRWFILQNFTDYGYGFLAFDYRGYGKSQGTPSEKGLSLDMEAASDYLEKQGIPLNRQIALGESIGSGVAVDVAYRRQFAALIIFSALSTAADVAKYLRESGKLSYLGVLPLEAIMRQRFDSLSKISKVKSPVFIIHGDHDEMMPLSMPKALFAQITSSPKKLLIIQGATHNSIFPDVRSVIMPSLANFLSKVKSNAASQ